jgi:nitroreductase
MSDHPASGFDLETVDHLLTTTRAVRRRLDFTRPVSFDVVRDCLEIAVQAPTGTNAQTWRWIVVADSEKRRRLADLYQHPPSDRSARIREAPVSDTPQQRRVTASSQFLIEHMHEVPLLVVPCILDAGGAAGWPPSIYPAVWNFMLALRSRGIGTVLTTVHLFRKEEAAELLGIPDGYVQACMLPLAYYTGEDFRPAVRKPIEEVAFLDGWGRPFSV